MTTHATGPYFPGDHINILCDDGYELQLKGQIYEISQIFCDKYGKWNVDDIVGELPECAGKVQDFFTNVQF